MIWFFAGFMLVAESWAWTFVCASPSGTTVEWRSGYVNVTDNLAIDPGKSTGWALVNAAGVLIACGRGQDFPPCRICVIELPQIYRPGLSPARPEDLVTLAVRVGQYKERVECRGAKVILEQPATWKHQVKKAIHHPRIAQSLMPVELKAVAKGIGKLTEKQAEDVWDAVGLAKWSHTNGRFR